MIFMWIIFWILVLSIGLVCLSPRLISSLLSYAEPEEYTRQVRIRLRGKSWPMKFELLRTNRQKLGSALVGAAAVCLLPLIVLLARF